MIINKYFKVRGLFKGISVVSELEQRYYTTDVISKRGWILNAPVFDVLTWFILEYKHYHHHKERTVL